MTLFTILREHSVVHTDEIPELGSLTNITNAHIDNTLVSVQNNRKQMGLRQTFTGNNERCDLTSGAIYVLMLNLSVSSYSTKLYSRILHMRISISYINDQTPTAEFRRIKMNITNKINVTLSQYCSLLHNVQNLQLQNLLKTNQQRMDSSVFFKTHFIQTAKPPQNFLRF